MTELEKIRDKVNQCYEQGKASKDIAIRDDDHLDEFLKASEAYLQAAQFADQAIKIPEASLDFTITTEILKEYYLYEAGECNYGYTYKHGLFQQAIAHAKEAKRHIVNALELIDKNIDKVKPEIQQRLSRHRTNWTLSSLSIKLRILEPIAKRAMRDQDYITALDTYTQLDLLQDEVHNYVKSSALEQVYKRTEEANYLAAKASLAISRAGVYLDKTDANNYDREILEQFLIAYQFSKASLDANPEQARYKQGLEAVSNNIVALLKQNPDNWREYLIEISDTNLIKIMQKTDSKKYNAEKAKIEIEKSSTKKLLVIGPFWLGILIVIYFMVIELAKSDIAWYKLIVSLVAIPTFFTIVGAFALRSVDALKEQNFIRLMELTLRINLKGLKVLSRDTSDQDKP